MDAPFDVVAMVRMPDGSEVELAFNLFNVKREFCCPICSSIGEDEKISMQSWSDHFARHYMENNRAGEINRAITEDMKKPVVAGVLRNDVSRYDRAVDEYDNAVNRVIMEKPRHAYSDNSYNTITSYDMSEEHMLRLAMEESLRESEAAVAFAKSAAEVSAIRIDGMSESGDDTVTAGNTTIPAVPIVSTATPTAIPTYPTRKKKTQ